MNTNLTDTLTGVILAAGKGARMTPFSLHWPKPILPILSTPLIVHQIGMMKSIGIVEIFVVIGYLGYEVVRLLGDGSSLGVKVNYIEQTDALGIAHAVGRLEEHVSSPFLLCLGDIFFVSSNLKQMRESFQMSGAKAVLASKVEADPKMIRRNFVILTESDGRQVRRVIEKPRHFTGSNLKGCGVYLFGLEVFDAIRRTPRTAMRNEYEITEAIQIMINDGHKVLHAEIIEQDLNLTEPDDLLSVNMLELEKLNRDNFFAGEAAPESRLNRCVVGRDVVFGSSVSLDHTVIFDHVKIPAGTDLSHAILTPQKIIQCSRVSREAK